MQTNKNTEQTIYWIADIYEAYNLGLRSKSYYEASHDRNANAARNFLDVEIEVLFHFLIFCMVLRKTITRDEN